jgi:hypothetical protein
MVSKTLILVLVLIVLVIAGISLWVNLTSQGVQVLQLTQSSSKGNLQLTIGKPPVDKDVASLKLVVLKNK